MDFVPGSSVMAMGKGRHGSSGKKPPGHPVLKGPHSHQVSLIYLVSVLIKLGLKHHLASFLHICMWPQAVLSLSLSLWRIDF